MLSERVESTGAEVRERATGDSADCPYLSRFRRLTPREVRFLILAVQEGLSYRELADVLGVTRGNVANTMQAIRRKLAVPRSQDLGRFVRANAALATAVLEPAAGAEGSHPTSDRRAKDLLRTTIAEFQSVGSRARRRAASLRQLSVRDETVLDTSEIRLLREVADLADMAAAHALTVVRQGD